MEVVPTMRNVDRWHPSKYRQIPGGWASASDTREVGLRSRLVTNRVARAYEAALRGHATGALLDVGCGKVPLYGIYRDLVSEVVCIDWPNTIHEDLYTDVQADLNVGIPLSTMRFDTVLATDVLEHLRNPQFFCDEVARVLRPCGKLLLGVPFLYGIHEEPHDYFRYTRNGLSWLCRQSGLDVVEVTPYGGPLAVVLDLVGKNVPWSSLALLYQTAANWLANSAIGVQCDARNIDQFPLGYCLIARKPM